MDGTITTAVGSTLSGRYERTMPPEAFGESHGEGSAKMQIGPFVGPDSSGKLYLGLTIADGAMRAEIFIADKQHVDDVVKQFIAGLRAAAQDLKTRDTSLEYVSAIPEGLGNGNVRKSQGGFERRSRSAGQEGPRTPKG